MTYPKSFRHVTSSFLLLGLGMIALEACQFDDRDLEKIAEERRRGPNGCEYAFDDRCDEPGLCPRGTDTADCEGFYGDGDNGDGDGDPANSCTYANNGECNEPDLCDQGTDTTDCENVGPDDCCTAANNCDWANDDMCDCGGDFSWDDADCGVSTECPTLNDGICDEPDLCDEGTDPWDCFPSSPDDSCANADDGICDEGTLCPFGSDASDCTDAPASDDSCEYAQDGYCDEGTEYCDYGTDATDCATLTATSACYYASYHLAEVGLDCFEAETPLSYCGPETEQHIRDLFTCAFEVINVTCEDFEAGIGTPVCDDLYADGYIDFDL